MPRHPSIKRPTKLTLMLPEDIRQRLDRHLYDPAMGRIPVGAYQNFFVALINERLARATRL